MEMHIFGVLYTVLFVILCIMFIGTFAKKENYQVNGAGMRSSVV